MSICVQNKKTSKGLLSCSEPKGIGSILGSDQCDSRLPKTGENSIRRTLSADMSSKKWLNQHGFSPLKKIASSQQIKFEVISEEDNNNNNKNKKTDLVVVGEEQTGQYDIWCSILSQKPSTLPPPYVHPLVKKSKTSLTGKSLEICTENLGSESGSDGFSSYSPSEISSDEEQEVTIVEEQSKNRSSQAVEEMGIINHSSSVSRKSSSFSSPPRSFPPPLPSLSGNGGGGLHMRPHRQDGRLVLEAVPVPTSQNYFHAQRQDGRLLLTFINPSQNLTQNDDEEEDIDEEFEEFEFSDEENEEEIEEQEEEEETVMMIEEEEEEEERELMLEAMKVPKLPTGVINVHRSALMVNKLMNPRNNRNPSWFDHEEEEEESIFPQSLPAPPPPSMSRLIPTRKQEPPPPPPTVSFNAYKYCWRRQSSVVVSGCGVHYPLINNQQQNSLPNTQKNYYNSYSNNITKTTTLSTTTTTSAAAATTTKNNNNKNPFVTKGHQNVVVMSSGGEKVDKLSPYLRSCKEPRRSLLSWEPYCIATS